MPKDYTLNEQLEFEKKVILGLNDVLNLLPAHLYQPVWLHEILPVTVTKNTSIQIDVSAFLKTLKLQTIHIVTFSPFNTYHSLINDPLNLLKILSFKDVVKGSRNLDIRPNAVLHVIGFAGTELLYHKISSKDLNNIDTSAIIKSIQTYENKYHMPLLNCNNNCIFKTKCFPKGIRI